VTAEIICPSPSLPRTSTTIYPYARQCGIKIQNQRSLTQTADVYIIRNQNCTVVEMKDIKLQRHCFGGISVISLTAFLF